VNAAPRKLARSFTWGLHGLFTKLPPAVNRCSCAALELMTDWSTTLSKPEEIMKKLIAILMASLFAVGAAYAADAKKDDKKADAKKEEKKK
jgi:hypothetical protein